MAAFVRREMIDPLDHLRLVFDYVIRHPGSRDLAGGGHELIGRRAKGYLLTGNFLYALNDFTDWRQEVEVVSHRSVLRRVSAPPGTPRKDPRRCLALGPKF